MTYQLISNLVVCRAALAFNLRANLQPESSARRGSAVSRAAAPHNNRSARSRTAQQLRGATCESGPSTFMEKCRKPFPPLSPVCLEERGIGGCAGERYIMTAGQREECRVQTEGLRRAFFLEDGGDDGLFMPGGESASVACKHNSETSAP